ncbi:MAG: UDP-N-acetylmuramate--L-alanine ligase, partial [Sciscionella sp.]
MTAAEPEQLSRAHLIGIGGAGMSGLARLLLDRGCAVSGSDAKQGRSILALQALGARVAVGQSAANLDLLGEASTAVVMTSAIREDNVELLEARRRGLPVLHRAQALALLMRGYRNACVAGTHGKTSTTSMLTVALQHCGADPCFAIGGDLNKSGSNAHHGLGDIFVAEADESDGSFLAFEPCLEVVTNVEADHLDHHGSLDAYVRIFDEFVDRLSSCGVLIACADDPGSAALADRAQASGVRVRRYGFAATGGADARLSQFRPADPVSGHLAGSSVTVGLDGDELTLTVGAPGTH